ncbi:hypothetical protein [Caballeronia ptereochthonis]|nr:hypothetical protein [Caballeronia ptereochthonis]
MSDIFLPRYVVEALPDKAPGGIVRPAGQAICPIWLQNERDAASQHM